MRNKSPESVSLTLPVSLLDQMYQETLERRVISPTSPDETVNETAGLVFGSRLGDKSNRRLLALGSFIPTTAINRSTMKVSIGGEECEDYKNWADGQIMPTVSRFAQEHPDWTETPTEVTREFGLVGTWHAHPGGPVYYSNMDDGQVDRLLDFHQLDGYMFAVALMRFDPDRYSNQLPPNSRLIRHRPQSSSKSDPILETKFFYRSRPGAKTTVLAPNVVDSNRLPSLPPAPWYVRDRGLLDTELTAFEELNFQVVPQPLRPEPGGDKLQIWLGLTHPNIDGSIFVRTPTNFGTDRKIWVRFADPDQQPDAAEYELDLTPMGTIADALLPFQNK